jgi:hypothetical protein
VPPVFGGGVWRHGTLTWDFAFSGKTLDMQHRAIETRYKGYRFRSRLEARWAVFFDHLGWPWEYEPEGYELPGGVRFLPDFRVAGYIVEIKPTTPTEDEKTKAKLLSQSLGEPVVFGIGLPDAEKVADGLDGFDGDQWIPGLLSFSQYCLNKWGRPGIVLYDTPEAVDFDAANAARAARFEFGESGARRG